MSIRKEQKEIERALLSKALGCTTQEIVEEYGFQGDDFVLQKRKTSTKSYPPDLSALQMLLGDTGDTNKYSKLSSEQLEKEKERLLNLLEKKK